MSNRVALVKLLEERYVEDFLNGKLCINTCAYFSELEQGDAARADVHDGATEALQAREVAIQGAQGEWIPIGGIQNPITYRSGEVADLNVLCFYTLTDSPNDRFDEKNQSFGNIAIFIADLPEFIRRVRHAVALKEWKVAHAPVEYMSRTHEGYMGPFRKFIEFSYQKEFRFVFTTGMRVRCFLEVGDLRDIVRVTSISSVESISSAMRSTNT